MRNRKNAFSEPRSYQAHRRDAVEFAVAAAEELQTSYCVQRIIGGAPSFSADRNDRRRATADVEQSFCLAIRD